MAGYLCPTCQTDFTMASGEDTRHKEWLIGKIMDAMFDTHADISEELHADLAVWLLDETDAALKEKHMRRKFDEIMESPDIGMPSPKKPHPVKKRREMIRH